MHVYAHAHACAYARICEFTCIMHAQGSIMYAQGFLMHVHGHMMHAQGLYEARKGLPSCVPSASLCMHRAVLCLRRAVIYIYIYIYICRCKSAQTHAFISNMYLFCKAWIYPYPMNAYEGQTPVARMCVRVRHLSDSHTPLSHGCVCKSHICLTRTHPYPTHVGERQALV